MDRPPLRQRLAMALIDLLPETLDVRVLAGDDLVLNLLFESSSDCLNPTYVNLSSANITATIINGNLSVMGAIDTANSANGSLKVTWNQTQTTSLANLTRPWYLQITQGDYDWTPITGKVEVITRG
jgi:hypothetical protein